MWAERPTMLTAKRIPPGAKVRLRLIATESDLRLDDEFQDAPTIQPILLALDDSEVFDEYVANDIDDIRLDRELYAIFRKFQETFDIHTDEEPPLTLRFEAAREHGRRDLPARLADRDSGRWP
jgi:hypothetical protein